MQIPMLVCLATAIALFSATTLVNHSAVDARVIDPVWSLQHSHHRTFHQEPTSTYPGHFHCREFDAEGECSSELDRHNDDLDEAHDFQLKDSYHHPQQQQQQQDSFSTDNIGLGNNNDNHHIDTAQEEEEIDFNNHEDDTRDDTLTNKHNHKHDSKQAKKLAKKLAQQDYDWLRKHLSTKAPYPHSDLDRILSNNNKNNQHLHKELETPKGYELVQLHLICRHGTRYPSRKKSLQFRLLAKKLLAHYLEHRDHIEQSHPGQQPLSEDSLAWLKTWDLKRYPLTKGDLLAPAGDQDLYKIGRRFGTRYSYFLKKYPYDAKTFEFRSSIASRSSQSAFGFAIGLLEKQSEDKALKDEAVDDDDDDDDYEHDHDIDTEDDVENLFDHHHHKHHHHYHHHHENKKCHNEIHPVDIYTVPKGLDQEMAVKYACPRWLEFVDGPDSTAGYEQELYINRTYPEMAKRISERFFGPDHTLTKVIKTGSDGQEISVSWEPILTVQDLDDIYQLCAFEMSFFDNVKTWCQILLRAQPSSTRMVTTESVSDDTMERTMIPKPDYEGQRGADILTLETAGDLGDYYKFGVGSHFNKHVGCVIGTSLYDSIQRALNSSSEDGGNGDDDKDDDDTGDEEDTEFYRGVLKFGHSETIMFFSTFLGLYKEPLGPLRANMTDTELANRQFRSSVFSPFAANMAFEVYRSQSVSNDDGDEQGLVRLLVNELPFQIPGCEMKGGMDKNYLCPWSVFGEILKKAGVGCDFTTCCQSRIQVPVPGGPGFGYGHDIKMEKGVFSIPMTVAQGAGDLSTGACYGPQE